MASRFYSLNRGQTEFQVTEGAASASMDIELRIDLAKGWTPAEVQIKLRELGDHILKNASGAMAG